MENQDLQRLLAAAGYYSGALDGIVGQKTLAGVDQVLDRRRGECVTDPGSWTPERRRVGAAQLILKHAGFSPGAIDGYYGNQTAGALLEWRHQQTYGKPLELDRRPVAPTLAQATRFPTQAECTKFYGRPGDEVEKQLVAVDLPFAMRIDWNLAQAVKTVRLHQKCADSAKAAMAAILSHYGLSRLQELGLDRNAGTYVNRPMRGGSSPSMHAFGAAWDFYAAPNGLTTRCPQALFCKADYKAFFDIWEAHGWVSLGRAIGRDWMHVQAARL